MHGTRNQIVFPHIMKTAGTTLIGWIQRHYRVDEVLFDASNWTEYSRLAPGVATKPNFIRGHFGSYISRFYPDAATICVLRDPTERVISHYWHAKQAEDDDIQKVVGDPGYSLEEFLEDERFFGITRNYQLANLSFDLKQEISFEQLIDMNACAFAHGSPSERHYRQASEFLAGCALLGVTEQLSSFIQRANSIFGFYPERALSRHRHYPRRAEVSVDTVKKIERLNEADRQLYELAKHISESSRSCVTSLPTAIHHASSWQASEALYGSGWSDIQMPSSQLPIHRWTEATKHSRITLGVPDADEIVVNVDILRFVSPEQRNGFRLTVNGNAPASISYEPDPLSSDRAVISARFTGPFHRGNCIVGLHLDKLISFSEVDPSSNDYSKRGVAVHSIQVLRFKDD